MALLNLTREELREVRDEAKRIKKHWEKMASGTPTDHPFHSYVRVWSAIEAKATKACNEQ